MKTGIKVGDAMTKRSIVVSPETTVKKCANIMIKNEIGCLIVKKNKELLGILTESDIIKKVVANNYDGEKKKAKDIMTKIVVTIEPDKDLYEALLKIKEEGVRRLPVIKDGVLVGILSEKDILKIQPGLFDLLVERFRIKEEESKLLFSGRGIKGECDNCGDYKNLSNIAGRFLCKKCSKSFF